jgi:hypothetical protein
LESFSSLPPLRTERSSFSLRLRRQPSRRGSILLALALLADDHRLGLALGGAARLEDGDALDRFWRLGLHRIYVEKFVFEIT